MTPAQAGTTGTASNAWVVVCRTCERNAPPLTDGRTKGRMIADELAELLPSADLHDRLRLRVVSCLSACLRPGNVSLRATGKHTLRLSSLETGHAPALIALVADYLEHPTGDVSVDDWPQPLQQTPVTRIPPPPGAKR